MTVPTPIGDSNRPLLTPLKKASETLGKVVGKGDIMVNNRPLDVFFGRKTAQMIVRQPLELMNVTDTFDVKVSVSGGGTTGQAGALRHAVARALAADDPSLREVLKNSGCLTRDARMKERKKAGQPGARKRFQFSKR